MISDAQKAIHARDILKTLDEAGYPKSESAALLLGAGITLLMEQGAPRGELLAAVGATYDHHLVCCEPCRTRRAQQVVLTTLEQVRKGH